MISTTRSKVRIWAVVFWIGIWQIASIIIGNEILLVSPISVMLELSKLIITADFWSSIGTSMIKIIAGFISAVVMGTILGAAAAKHKRVRELLTPLVVTIKTIPVASFIILVLIWISSEKLSVFISFIMVFPLIYTNVLAGMDHLDIKMSEMAEIFQISGYGRVKYIYFSQVVPYLKSAVSVGLGMCWKAGVAAEVIGLPEKSIGENLYEAKIFLDTPALFAWTVVIICISILFEKVFMTLFEVVINKMESAT